LQTSLKPPHLSDGVSWSRHFHLLDRFSDWRSDATTSARTSQAERGCLGSLDIPIFSTTTLGTDLALPDGTAIENQFEVSSFEQVALRVAGLSLASMAKSSHLIAVSLSLAARDDAPRRTCFFTSEDGDDRFSPQEQELTDDRAIAQAEGIADLLARAAIRADDGVSWIGPVPLPGHWRHQIAVLGPDICSGAGGIALFLSALHACTSRAKDRELAISALEPFRMELLAPSRRARLARVMTLGGGAGVGSLIYALVRVGHFLSDNSLIDDADSLLATITDRMIFDDRSFGLMYGTAGAILGMLALCGDARARQSAYSPFGRALDRAIACGRHLLNSLNKRDWPQNQDTYDRTERDAPGFLPRNAAIALALLRLHAASGEAAFYDAGCSLYESELTRLSGGDAEMLAGRGLACLACSRILKDSQASGTLIDAATRLTMAAADPSDQLHTGNLACLDYLLEASQHFQPDLATIARRRLCLPLRQGQSISRIRCAGKNIDHLGFFDGLAGIGYQTLRFRYPGRLPSVLLLE
jgi:lantibiotic modifying enzyme